MKFLLSKERNHRLNGHKFEKRYVFLKAVWLNLSLPFIIRYRAFLLLNLLPKKRSKVRCRNRCIFTGRSRAVVKEWRVSRLKFRDCARHGSLFGVRRSSW